eukprot:331903-Amphidinium_carterae.1
MLLHNSGWRFSIHLRVCRRKQNRHPEHIVTEGDVNLTQTVNIPTVHPQPAHGTVHLELRVSKHVGQAYCSTRDRAPWDAPRKRPRTKPNTRGLRVQVLAHCGLPKRPPGVYSACDECFCRQKVDHVAPCSTPRCT